MGGPDWNGVCVCVLCAPAHACTCGYLFMHMMCMRVRRMHACIRGARAVRCVRLRLSRAGGRFVGQKFIAFSRIYLLVPLRAALAAAPRSVCALVRAYWRCVVRTHIRQLFLI